MTNNIAIQRGYTRAQNVAAANRISPRKNSGYDTLRPVDIYAASVSKPAPDNIAGAICASVGYTKASAQTLPTARAVPKKTKTNVQSPKVPAALDWGP